MEKIDKRVSKNDKKYMLIGTGCCLTVVGVAVATCVDYHKKFKEYDAKNLVPNADNSSVIINGEKYYADRLYVLTSENEKHLCYTEFRRNQTYIIEKEYDSGNAKIKSQEKISSPFVYVDIQTKDEIAIQGYEDWSNYKVTALVDDMDFSTFDVETKSSEMSNEEFESLVNKDAKSKRLVLINGEEK